MSAQTAKIAFLALIFTVAALASPQSARAASGNVQICNPSANCTIGEFIYSDSYAPVTTATCGITSRYPDGTLHLNNVNMPASSEGDGWYAYSFTAPTTLGLYRTEVKCTVGSDTMALDKSFEIQTAPSTLTTSDIASAVWGYSGRSLTTFGTLIADIWENATRTITGFDSGSFATSTDVSGVKTEVTDVKSKTDDIKSVADKIKKLVEEFAPSTSTSTTNITNIQNLTNTTNNMLEQIINRPIVENGLEESSFTTTELQSKLDKSESLANQLLTSGAYVKSKTNLLKLRWNNLGQADITKSLDQIISVVDTMSDQINWIAEQWDLPVSSKLQFQNKKLAVSLKKVNSTLSLKNLSSDLDNFIKLVGKSGDSSKSNTLFGQLNGQKELLSSLDKNYTDATTLVADIGNNSKPKVDVITQINTLSTQVAVINQLPKMNKTILSRADAKMNQKQLKNKTLSLRGIVGANKQFLAQKPDEPLRSFWFEEGSIVFKTLISNPSKSISQKVPLKYYLPKEVNRENIIKTDEELTVNYDTEKDQYFVSGQFTLASGETKTLSVTVDDSAFYINDAEIATMRKQTEELSKPLQNTAYFAQGVTLKTDIDASLDKVDSLQKTNTTPEARIRSYRESIIEFKAAKAKLEKLKELATQAGSVGTLFGFVGGAQAIAVWGLIIIMAAGFVFLALYMRSLRMNGETTKGDEGQFSGPGFGDGSHGAGIFGRTIRFAAVVIASGLLAGLVVSFVLAKNQNLSGKDSDNSVLGQTEVSQEMKNTQESRNEYEEVEVFVPEDSIVNIYTSLSLDSEVLLSLSSSQKAVLLTTDNGWAKVKTEGDNSVEGWVDQDFVEREEKSSPSSGIESSGKLVEIKDNSVGFLRVREMPWGQEITKVTPGERFELLEQKGEWSKISLDDDRTDGWVSSNYVVSLR
ncbi:SH3 domain-containing protein [Candidatus Microgenomates bacterium]|nr:SH3 domain-containing protein [Candidatus Microgenomates bacterium]